MSHSPFGRRLAACVGAVLCFVAVGAGANPPTEHRSVGAWGYNGYGQLGDDTNATRAIPVQVRAPREPVLTGVLASSASYNHSLACRTDGTALSWGYNAYGQLGTGDYESRGAPGLVVGPGGAGILSNVVGVAAGDYHSLAVKADGTVWAWGANWYGQLGNGTTTDSPAPVQVLGPGGTGHLTGIVAVAASTYHCLALGSDGSVWAWGSNGYGQLGDGTGVDSQVPVQVVDVGGTGQLENAIGIAAGSQHSLVVRANGTVVAFGDNSQAQLGIGVTGGNSLAPMQVMSLTGAKQVAAGNGHSLARKSDGTVRAWGDNSYGQLGDGTTTRRASPVAVSGITAASSIGAGHDHSLCTLDDGTARAWGYNGNGQLGDGTTTDQPVPVAVSGLSSADASIGGGYHSLWRTSDGRLWACGYNGNGQLGDNTWSSSSTPIAVLGPTVGWLEDVTSIAAGQYQTLAAKSDGTAWGWGYNGYGQLGDGTTTGRQTPVQVVGPGGVGFLTEVVQVSTMYDHSAAVRSDGTVWCWGSNWAGELGDGTQNSSTTPVQVVGPGGSGYLTDVARVSAGQYHTLALKKDGTVWAWGNNGSGELGDGTGAWSPYPVQVVGPDGTGLLTDIRGIAAGTSHSLAVGTNGSVYAWGNNGVGQLGIGVSFGYSLVPLLVSTLTDATQVSAGESLSLAVKGDGTVWSWGFNGYGQLGDGTTTDRNVPGQVPGLTGCAEVAAGTYHCMALTSGHQVWSWGANWYGALGDGTYTDSTVPVQVLGPDGVHPLNHIRAIAAGGYHSVALWVNTVPVADPQTVTALTAIGKPITLTGSDGDGDPLTYEIVSGPVAGNLTGTAPNLTYTSAPNFSDVDSFSFIVTDGYDVSAPQTVTIHVEKAPTSTLVSERTGTISELVTLRCYVKRVADGAWVVGASIAFKVDGTSVGSATTDANGRADLNWVISEGPATRTVTADFPGDSGRKASSGSAKLTCLSWTTKMVTFNRTARITDRTELKARLLRSDNAPIYGRSIRFSIDGTFIIARNTNVDGYASYPNYDVPNGSGAGVRTILSEWVGNGGYAAISKTATLTVNKAIPYIWVLGKNVPYGGVANLYAYFRRLYDYQKQTGKTVDFKIDGTPIQTVVTDGVGVARYLYPTAGLGYGGHTIRCEFAGDAWLDAGYGENYLNIY